MERVPDFVRSTVLPRTTAAIEASANVRHLTTLLEDAPLYRCPADHLLVILLPPLQPAVLAFYRGQERRLWKRLPAKDIPLLDEWCSRQVALIDATWDSIAASYPSSRMAARALSNLVTQLDVHEDVARTVERILRQGLAAEEQSRRG